MDFGVIDCDFHPAVNDGVKALDPYLTAAQRDRLAWLGIGASSDEIPVLNYRPPGRAHHFTEAIRQDCVPPNGGLPASDIDFIRSHHLDPHGIAATVLIPIQAAIVDFWTYADEAAWFVSAFNDLFCEQWLASEPRFNLDMVVSPLDTDLAVKEIRRVGPRPGVAAVFAADDRPPLRPPLLLSDLRGGPGARPADHGASDVVERLLRHRDDRRRRSEPLRRAVHAPERVRDVEHLSSLIFEGVFERYPRLKFVFVEFGWTWIASLLWRMDAVWKAARRHHPWMTKSPTEYVLEHVRITTEPALECPAEWLDDAIAMANGSQTLLYSSDYPHWDSEEPWVAFKHIDDGLRRRIFRDNALDFLGERLRIVDPVPALV